MPLILVATLIVAACEAALKRWQPLDSQGVENGKYLAFHYLPLIALIFLKDTTQQTLMLAAVGLYLFWEHSRRAGLGAPSSPYFIVAAVAVAAFYYVAFRRSTLLFQGVPIAAFLLVLLVAAFQPGQNAGAKVVASWIAIIVFGYLLSHMIIIMNTRGERQLITFWLIAKFADVVWQAVQRFAKAPDKGQVPIMVGGGVLGAIVIYGVLANYRFSFDQKAAVIGAVLGAGMGIAMSTSSYFAPGGDSRRVSLTAVGLAFALPLCHHALHHYR